MIVGRVLTVGGALHILHCRESGVEAVAIDRTSTLPWIAVCSSGGLPKVGWTPLPAYKLAPWHPSCWRTVTGVSARPGGSGLSCIADSPKWGELKADAGEKYAVECSVDVSAAAGMSSDIVGASSSVLACGGYP